MNDMSPTKRKAGMICMIVLAAFGFVSAIGKKPAMRLSSNDQFVKLYYRLELFDASSGRLMKVNDSLLKLIGDGITGYQYYIPGERVSADANGRSQRLLGETLGYRFFFYHEKDGAGNFYDSVSVKKAQKLPVDSMLRTKFSVQGSMFYQETNQLVTSVKQPDGRLFEKYIPASRPDESYPDSICLWYDPALNDLKYSFNPTLDSLRDVKMYKALFIFNRTKNIPRREFEFRFERAAVSQQKEIQFIKERFVKESGNL